MTGRSTLALAAFVAVAWLSRAPLAPPRLFYFDSVNYALALDHFNPALHQPQPPGSPFYVLLCRGLRLLAGAPEPTFLLSGILAAALSAWLLWTLARRLYGESAAWAAALLLLLHPVNWLATLTNQARAYLAVASAGVAYLALRASAREAPVHWLYSASLLAGVLGGFRAEAPILLAPLLVWAAWRRRASWREWLLMIAAGAVPSALWLGWVFAATGGPAAYFALLRAYSADQFTQSSPLFGASFRQTWRMIEVALVFNFLGVAVWLWALAKRRAPLAGRWAFLAVWFLPAFLFQLTVHVYDPDHALLTVPVLCLIGGHVLANAFRSMPARIAAIAVACALSAALFAHPLRGAARPLSYQVVARVNAALGQAFAAIDDARRHGPVTVILGKTLVTWRHLTYYYPDAEVWVGKDWSPSGAQSPTLAPGRRYVTLDAAITTSQTPPAGFAPAASVDPPAMR